MLIHPPPSPNTARTARRASRRLVTFRNVLYVRRAERRTTTKKEDGWAEPRAGGRGSRGRKLNLQKVSHVRKTLNGLATRLKMLNVSGSYTCVQAKPLIWVDFGKYFAGESRRGEATDSSSCGEDRGFPEKKRRRPLCTSIVIGWWFFFIKIHFDTKKRDESRFHGKYLRLLWKHRGGSFFIKRKSLDVRKVEKAKVLFLHEETMQPLTT